MSAKTVHVPKAVLPKSGRDGICFDAVQSGGGRAGRRIGKWCCRPKPVTEPGMAHAIIWPRWSPAPRMRPIPSEATGRTPGKPSPGRRHREKRLSDAPRFAGAAGAGNFAEAGGDGEAAGATQRAAAANGLANDRRSQELKAFGDAHMRPARRRLPAGGKAASKGSAR